MVVKTYFEMSKNLDSYTQVTTETRKGYEKHLSGMLFCLDEIAGNKYTIVKLPKCGFGGVQQKQADFNGNQI